MQLSKASQHSQQINSLAIPLYNKFINFSLHYNSNMFSLLLQLITKISNSSKVINRHPIHFSFINLLFTDLQLYITKDGNRSNKTRTVIT